jgi:ATP-binding cassette subfamily B protein
MAKVIAGKTVLMIAHRLSTITDADKIVVVKDGQIVDEGIHEELLDSCMLYQEMWKAHTDTKDEA